MTDCTDLSILVNSNKSHLWGSNKILHHNFDKRMQFGSAHHCAVPSLPLTMIQSTSISTLIFTHVTANQLNWQNQQEVSYRKQIMRQHSCHKLLVRAGDVVDHVKISFRLVRPPWKICFAVCYTMWAYVIGWGTAPHPFDRGRIWPSRNKPLPTCYSAKFGPSRSNHISVGRGGPKIFLGIMGCHPLKWGLDDL